MERLIPNDFAIIKMIILAIRNLTEARKNGGNCETDILFNK